MEYALIYTRLPNQSNRVLVVKKDRPAWQAGRFNLVGGKIEQGETPEQCAVRELLEETGLKPAEGIEPKVIGAIYGSWGTVYCVKVCVFDSEIKPQEGETEEFQWMDWSELKDSPLLIPNLRVIVPMCMAGVTDWVIRDEGPNWDNRLHTIEVTVNS